MPPLPRDTRTQILRATLELVGAEGVGGVTNRSVARRANVALGSLTYHFESQTVLLREALELFIAEETARLGALADALGDAALTEEQAVAALQALLEQEPERRIAKLEIYLQATRDEQLRPAALQCFEAYDRLAASALAALGVAEPGQVAPVMVALVDGLQLRRLAAGEEHLRITEPLTTVLRALRGGS